MKYILKDNKNPLPIWDSYCGLHKKEWEKLNSGLAVDLKKVPEAAKPYLTKDK